MKNKKIKIIVISISILTIILFIILIKLKNRINKNGGFQNILSSNNAYMEVDWDDEAPGIDDDIEYDYEEDEDILAENSANYEKEGLRDELYTEKPVEVTSSIYFATVKNILETFLKDIGTMSTKQYLNKADEYSISNSDLRKKTINRLTNNYLNENEIEIYNISQKLRIPYTDFSVNIKKMMQFAIKNNNILRFAVSLNIQNDEEKPMTNSFIVYLDYEQQSYAIEPIGNKDIEDLDLNSDISYIEKNINNTYTYVDE